MDDLLILLAFLVLCCTGRFAYVRGLSFPFQSLPEYDPEDAYMFPSARFLCPGDVLTVSFNNSKTRTVKGIKLI